MRENVAELLKRLEDTQKGETICLNNDEVQGILELLKEQQPMKPVYDCPLIKCPKCKNSIDILQKYCDECGQAIDWSKDGEQE